MKKVLLLTISILLLFTFVSCYYEPAVEHIHSYTEEYSVKDGKLYSTKKCECGDSSDTLVENALVATPENAQEKLDALKSGEILYFDKGEYTENLEIRNAKGNSVYYKRGNDSTYSEEITFDEMETIGLNKNIYRYLRTLENVTLIASENATFKCSLSVGTGHVYGISGSPAHDYVRDIDIPDTNNSYFADILLKNVTIKGFKFEGDQKEGQLKFNYYGTPVTGASYVDGLLIEGCSFVGADSENYKTNSYNGIRFKADTPDMFKNINIRNISVMRAFQGVYIQGADNLTIANSTFDTTNHNALAIQNGGKNSSKGEIVIENNTFKSIGDRIIRFGNVENAEVSIANNVIDANSGDASGEILKTATVTNSTYNFSGNTCDGKAMLDKSGTLESNFTISK